MAVAFHSPLTPIPILTPATRTILTDIRLGSSPSSWAVDAIMAALNSPNNADVRLARAQLRALRRHRP
jgi:hypothetical protein